MTGKPVRFAWAVEENEAGRHVHALLADCESLTVREVRDAWKAGLAMAHVYDPSRGAAFYDTKRVGKANGGESVEVSDDLPPRLRPALDHADCGDAQPGAAVLELVASEQKTGTKTGTARPLPVTRIMSPEPMDLEAIGDYFARLILRRHGIAA